jgi:tetratricopeptide (TPR) repeat protein
MVAMVLTTIAMLVLLAAQTPLGVEQYHKRNFAQAERTLRAALRADSKDERARLYLARTLSELKRLAEALVVLQPLTGQTAKSESRLEAGRLLRQLAESRFRALQRTAGGTAATMEIAARRLEREGDFTAALEQYRAVRRLEPDRPGIRYSIGSVLWKMRELPAAEPELRAELALRPTHSMANLRLGQLLMTTDRETEAVPFLEQAQKGMPHLPDIARELGKAYRKSGRLQEARSAFEAVAAAKPEDDQIHYLLSGLYRELGEADRAADELRKHRDLLRKRRPTP